MKRNYIKIMRAASLIALLLFVSATGLFAQKMAVDPEANTTVTVLVTVFEAKTNNDPFGAKGIEAKGFGALGGAKQFSTEKFISDFLRYENEGRATIINRAVLAVLHGKSGEYAVGRQIQSIKPTDAADSDKKIVEIINAGWLLKASPQVIDDADGNPETVALKIEIADNEVEENKTDGSVMTSADGTPCVIVREVNSALRIKLDETAVLGGILSKDGATRRYYAVRVGLTKN